MTIDLLVLRTEIDRPVYSGKTVSQIIGMLNARTIPRDRHRITGGELFEQIDPADLPSGLTGVDVIKRQFLTALVGKDAADIFIVGPGTRTLLGWIFGPGQTRSNIAALQVEMISRAEELELPVILPQHIRDALTLTV